MKKIKALLKWDFTRQFLALLLGLCLLAGCVPALADDPPEATVTAEPNADDPDLADITITVDGNIEGEHPGDTGTGLLVDDDYYVRVDVVNNSQLAVDTDAAVDGAGSQTIGDITINTDGISEDACEATAVEIATTDSDVDLTVSGDISAEGEQWAYGIDVFSVSENGTITVTTEEGNVSAFASSDGDNKADAAAINANAAGEGSVDIYVDGDVSASAYSKNGTGQAIAIDAAAAEGGDIAITVNGDVTAEAAGRQPVTETIRAEADNDGSKLAITVLGDVTAQGGADGNNASGWALAVSNYEGATTDIIIDGTLSADGVPIKLNAGSDEATPENIDLTAWAIQPDDDGKMTMVLAQIGLDEDKVAADFEARINYIVKIAEAYGKVLGASTGTTVTAGENTYATAVADEDVALSLQLGEDEVLEGVYYNSDDANTLTETANLQKNAAGSYVMKMLRGGGMLLGLKTHTHVRDTKKENTNDATCKDAGSYDEVAYCTVCEKELGRVKKTIPATDDHTPGNAVQENTVNATCKEAGSYEEAVYCTVCGKELGREKKTIPATDDHTPGNAVHENTVNATCKAAGSYEEVVYCTLCGKELSREKKTIPVTNNHTPGNAVHENTVNATCGEAGSYDEVVYCTVCEKELSRKTVALEKLPHTEDTWKVNEVEPTAETEGSYDLETYCTVCGTVLSTEHVTVPMMDDNTSSQTGTPDGGTRKIEGSVIWIDWKNAIGSRPASVTLHLYADGTEADSTTVSVATGQESVRYSFPDQPLQDAAGNDIAYTVAADPIEGYIIVADADYGTGPDMICRLNPSVHIPVSVSFTGDQDNADGNRPASVTVKLLADGQGIRSVVLPHNGQWEYTFEGLDYLNSGGTEIAYTVSVDPVPAYKPGLNGNGIVFRYTPEMTAATVAVSWDDDYNSSNIRPGSLVASLGNGMTVILDSGNNWTATIDKLPIRVNGEPMDYTFTLQTVRGYSQRLTEWTGRRTVYTMVADNLQSSDFGVKPKTAEKTEYVFDNSDMPLGTDTLPSSDGGANASIPTGSLPETDPDYYSDMGSPLEIYFDNDQLSGDPEGDLTFIDIPVTLSFNDNYDADGNRPESVTLRLFADGIEVSSHVLTSAEGWQYTFAALPFSNESGTPIKYTVRTDEVPMYWQEINGYSVVLNYEPAEVSASVDVVWNDTDNAQGTRPPEVAMTLYNGVREEPAAVVMLGEGNGWTSTVNHLPTVVDGKRAVYAFKVQQVLGYTLDYVEQRGNHMTFTLSVWARPENPTPGKKPKTPGQATYIFEDYDTPL